MMYKCGKCKQIKDIEEFHKNVSRKSRHNVWCKTCQAAYKILYKEKREFERNNLKSSYGVAIERVDKKETKKCFRCGMEKDFSCFSLSRYRKRRSYRTL